MSDVHLGLRFEQAMSYPLAVHGDQQRKGTEISYASHLLAVAAIVVEAGGDEDEAEGCTDAIERSDTDSRKRKQTYVRRLAAETDRGVLLVSLADKIANARSILYDYRQEGDRLFKRFSVGKARQLKYYRGLVESFRSTPAIPSLVDELDRIVTVLERLATAGTLTPNRARS